MILKKFFLSFVSGSLFLKIGNMQEDHGFFYSLAQDFSTLALLILQPKQFFLLLQGQSCALQDVQQHSWLLPTRGQQQASQVVAIKKHLQTLQKVPWVAKSLTFLCIPLSSIKNHGCGPITHCFPRHSSYFRAPSLESPRSLHFAYLAPSNCHSSHSQPTYSSFTLGFLSALY